MDLLDKYRPESFEGFIGNKKAIEEITSTLGKKPVLVHGPPGTGKTLSAYLLSKKLDLEIYEINASDYRDLESLQKVLLISKQYSIFGKKRLILIDEIDGLAVQDRGAGRELAKIFKESKNPIILTANDPYEPKLRNIKSYCKLVPFTKINYLSIANYLKEICKKERIEFQDITLKNIAQRCNGDIRCAVLDLESLISDKKILPSELLSPRDFEENIFNSVKIVLKTKKVDVAKDVMRNLDRNPEDFFWWIEENVCREYKDYDLKNALEYLSLADIIRRRITKRQDWILFRYYVDFISIGVALSKKQPYFKYVPYAFPTFISRMGAMKAKRAEIDEKVEKLQEHMKCSKARIREELPYLKQFLKI